MWGTSTLRTLAHDDLGTLAEHDPLTGHVCFFFFFYKFLKRTPKQRRTNCSLAF